MAAPPPTTVAADLVRGVVGRFTLLDECGVPEAVSSVFVTEGIITAQLTKNMDNGDEIKVRLMNGRIGTYEPGKSTMLNYTIDVNMSRIDPGAIAMCTGDAAILDSTGKIVGWVEEALTSMDRNVALELWTDTSAGLCEAGAKVYGYMLYPFISQSYITIDDVTDKEITAHLHGMSYPSPSGWGRGPYGEIGVGGDGSTIAGPVNTAAAGEPIVPGRLLLPVTAKEHKHFELTPVPPPLPNTDAGPISMTLPTVYAA